LNDLKDVRTENGSTHGHNLAVTGLVIPNCSTADAARGTATKDGSSSFPTLTGPLVMIGLL